MNDFDNKPMNEDEQAFKIVDTKEEAEVTLEDDKNNKMKKVIKEIYSYVIIIVVAFIFAQLIHHFLFTPVSVEGRSMYPTLHNDDYVLLWRLGEYERFDIVIFEAPQNHQYSDEKEYYIKRLIGLPGDYVEMKNDELFINGEEYEESYLNKGKNELYHTGNFTSDFKLEDICSLSKTECNIDGTFQIPEGYYLVLGDNRPNSLDSTELGLIRADMFIGKAKYILYPFNRTINLENN